MTAKIRQVFAEKPSEFDPMLTAAQVRRRLPPLRRHRRRAAPLHQGLARRRRLLVGRDRPVARGRGGSRARARGLPRHDRSGGAAPESRGIARPRSEHQIQLLKTKIGRLQAMVDETEARRARGEVKIAALIAEMETSARAHAAATNTYPPSVTKATRRWRQEARPTDELHAPPRQPLPRPTAGGFWS